MSNSKTQTITNIPKSKSDSNSYVLKILPNGLKALIISDPKIEQSAASMLVNTGSLSDPKSTSGVAHFCEHMLTMGSEKYPDESEFEQFLNKHSGSSNACTDLNYTNFYFNCSNSSFHEALDLFAQNFIHPLFSESSISKEIEIIDSEHQKNLTSDIWRFFQLTLSEYLPQSSFHIFPTGNLSTLQKPSIRDELITFYKKYYSPEIMNLCVYSSEDIDVISSYVEELFSQIPLNPSFIKEDFTHDIPYDETTSGFVYYIEPIQNKDTITFIWNLPNELIYYKERPLSYLTTLFGHEGPNTLTSSLVKDDLIIHLVTSKMNIAKTFSCFKLEVELTEKGMKDYNDVILRVFKYIKTIQDIGVNKRFFEELKQIEQLSFDYKQKNDSIKLVQFYTKTLLNYKYEDVLIGEQLYQIYDPKVIDDYLQKLLISTCNIYISSQTLSSKCNLVEPIYGTKYYKEKHSYNINDIISYKNKHKFDYPPENEFLPKDMSIIPSNENEPKYPECIYRSKRCVLWYKQDSKFKLPYAVIRCKIYFEKHICNNSNVVNSILSNILSAIVTNELRETVYMTEEAKVNFSLNITSEGIIITILGFNSSMYNVCRILIEQFVNIIFDNKGESYSLLYNKKLQQLSNFYFSNSYLVAYNYLEFALMDPSYPNNEVLSLMMTQQSSISFSLLLTYIKHFLKNIKLEWLIQGNISKEESLSIVTTCNSILHVDTSISTNIDINTYRSVNITSNTEYVYIINHPNKNEVNSSLCMFYQCGHLNLKEELILDILCSILERMFFDKIRTNEKIGYVVMLVTKCYRGNNGMIVLVQSSQKVPEFVEMKVKEFFREGKDILEKLTEKEFEDYRKGVLVKYKKEDLNLYEEVSRFLTEIVKHEYMFDRKERTVQLMQEIKKEEVIEFYMEHFVNDVRIFTMEYVANVHKEENEKMMNEIEGKGEEKMKRVKVGSISEFKMRNELFPDFYNLQE